MFFKVCTASSSSWLKVLYSTYHFTRISSTIFNQLGTFTISVAYGNKQYTLSSCFLHPDIPIYSISQWMSAGWLKLHHFASSGGLSTVPGLLKKKKDRNSAYLRTESATINRERHSPYSVLSLGNFSHL